TRCLSDWSSDVCSSDLGRSRAARDRRRGRARRRHAVRRPAGVEMAASMSGEVAILGAGMHPWGKWGRSFVEYGIEAAETALADEIGRASCRERVESGEG